MTAALSALYKGSVASLVFTVDSRDQSSKRLVQAAGLKSSPPDKSRPGWFSRLIVTRLLRHKSAARALVRILDRYMIPMISVLESKVDHHSASLTISSNSYAK